MNSQVKSPLCKGYLIQNKWSNRFVRLIDWTLSWFFLGKKEAKIQKPKRLLLVQPNHLGDVVLSTCLIAPLKKAFPDLEIGFLVGSWSQVIVAKNPDIARVHVFNHWRMNRCKISLMKKLLMHLKTFLKAKKEIQSRGYDTALLLSPYWANAIPLVYASSIKTRIGYSSGGFGSLLSHANAFDAKCHITTAFSELASKLPCKKDFFYPPEPKLKGVNTDFVPKGLKRGEYIVIQVGAGNPKKKWPSDKWIDLISKLDALGISLVFTGQGVHEAKDIEQVIKGKSFCYDLSNKLSWDEYVSTVHHGKLFLGVDSVGAHIASCFNVPTVIISGGIMGAMRQFRPVHHRVQVLSKSMPCNPCFFSKRGCDAMSCIIEVDSSDVLKAMRHLIELDVVKPFTVH